MILPDDLPWHTWLRKRMRYLGVSRDVLAQQMSVKKRAVQRWYAANESRPPCCKTDLLALLLGVPGAEVRRRLARDRETREAAGGNVSAVGHVAHHNASVSA